MNKQFFTATFILTLLLTVVGCVPVAIVAGAVAGGAIVNDQRNVQTIWHDNDIAYKIQANLNKNGDLYEQTHLVVVVFNKVVLLVGEAPTTALKETAGQIANKAAGTRRVYNEISIEPPIGGLIRSNDTWVTTKVKTQMVREQGLKSTQIKVVTENSVVYLLGSTTHTQADLAADVARRVEGVRKVVKLFEYIR